MATPIVDITEAADQFGALADPSRLRILELLAGRDRCVCHLVEELDLKQSLVSHHLGVLRRSGLVVSYPHPGDRRWTYYRLHREALRSLGGGLADMAGDAGYNPEPLPCPPDFREGT